MSAIEKARERMGPILDSIAQAQVNDSTLARAGDTLTAISVHTGIPIDELQEVFGSGLSESFNSLNLGVPIRSVLPGIQVASFMLGYLSAKAQAEGGDSQE